MGGDATRFSVVIPTYNSAMTIRDCLHSVFRQTFSSFEILVVDDGSSDGTPDRIPREYLSDPRFQLAIFSRNQGVSAARNFGLGRAIGTYLLFVDSDDHLDLRALSTLSKIIEKKSPDILQFGYTKSATRLLPKTERTPFLVEESALPTWIDTKPIGLLEGVNPAVWNKAFRTEFIRSKDLKFNERLRNGAEDLEFTYRAVLQTEQSVSTDLVLYHYRTESSHSLSSDPLNQWRESVTALYSVVANRDVRSIAQEVALFFWRRALSFAWRVIALDSSPTRLASLATELLRIAACLIIKSVRKSKL